MEMELKLDKLIYSAIATFQQTITGYKMDVGLHLI